MTIYGNTCSDCGVMLQTWEEGTKPKYILKRCMGCLDAMVDKLAELLQP